MPARPPVSVTIAMVTPADLDLLTIGHSNLPADRFMALVQQAGVTAIADVRSVPFSRRFPWFSGPKLSARLQGADIAYLPFGDALGGRPHDPALYCEGVADYERMAATPQFRTGLDHVAAAMGRFRVCLMCAEREPLDCHRCLLVGRALAARGSRLGHVLADGTIEPHAATEERLLGRAGLSDDLFEDRATQLAQAYRDRARKVAAHLKA
ncbi:MAG TPA: DUF488 domain-containing protein [Xanthobacteraceae bacterium]|jgi:uncharacterized protein (DUF488 family)